MEQNAVNAVLKNKEPYLMIQEVYELLKQIRLRANNRQLDPLLYAVKRLKENCLLKAILAMETMR